MTTDANEQRIKRIIEEIRAAQTEHDEAEDIQDLTDDDPEDDLAMLTVLLADIEKHVGGDLLDRFEPTLIGEFCEMTLIRNQGTGLMLRSLIESFMRAYSSPATSDQAIQALLSLEHLCTPQPGRLN